MLLRLYFTLNSAVFVGEGAKIFLLRHRQIELIEGREKSINHTTGEENQIIFFTQFLRSFFFVFFFIKKQIMILLQPEIVRYFA